MKITSFVFLLVGSLSACAPSDTKQLAIRGEIPFDGKLLVQN